VDQLDAAVSHCGEADAHSAQDLHVLLVAGHELGGVQRHLPAVVVGVGGGEVLLFAAVLVFVHGEDGVSEESDRVA